MRAQPHTMRVNFHSPTQSHQGPPPALPRSPGVEDSLWDSITLRELVERVEHQFGETPGLSGVFALGFGSDEWLTPGDIQAVCEHLGLPAEDFGIDP
jgi:hypothetical protein